MQGFKIKHFLFLALVIRLLLLPLAYHSDLNTNSIWGIYAREFGLKGYYDWLSFGNYARPEYPPLSTILFLMLRVLYEAVFAFFWKINITVSFFPSGIIVWLDKFGYLSLLKLPGIFADIGIGYLIYKVTKNKNLAIFYLFNPVTIYLSSLWGQTESVVGLFALVATLSLLKKKYLSAFWSMFVSLMIKATMLPLSVILIVASIRNKIKLSKVIFLFVCLVIGLFVLGFLFTDHAFINWSANSYVAKFITGAHSLEFLNLNAFNFWGLVFGIGRISDKPYLWLAWGIASVFYVPILIRFLKKGNIFYAALLVFYTSFMFLPKMHERYLYPVFIFFPFVIWKFSRLKRVFYLTSAVFLVNLMHGWMLPGNSDFVMRGLSFINLACFGYLTWNYLS